MPSPNKIPQLKERLAVLEARRKLKMARSAHAYVRGSTVSFYEWLDTAGGRAVPNGPAIWICGDCHVGNLGPIASAKGRISIQIRDLDQTVVGNPAHDLIRLGLSLASAARGSDLPGVTTAKMMEQMVDGYEQSFAGGNGNGNGNGEDEVERPEAVEAAMKAALRRKWKDLAKERIEGTKPTIPMGKTFWPLSDEERDQIAKLFATEAVRRLVTSLRSRDDEAAIEVLDAAYWVKGCSSLGLLRYAVLVAVGGAKGELCLIDIKEAVSTVAPRNPKATMPADHAERVVKGAWHLSPALGDRMIAARFQERAVFIRELLPQDLKFDIANLTREEAMKIAHFLAVVVGKAHARQMDEATRKSWQAELNRNRSKTLDAPSWLWTSVVELLASHEKAYLEHCRKYALAAAQS
jgi:uncharacterized protein (DUF2252 family)